MFFYYNCIVYSIVTVSLKILIYLERSAQLFSYAVVWLRCVSPPSGNYSLLQGRQFVSTGHFDYILKHSLLLWQLSCVFIILYF